MIKHDEPFYGKYTEESGGGGGGDGKYKLFDRIKDDTNTEIGSVSGFFTDANNNKYAVVFLDAKYRGADLKYCSVQQTITNLPEMNNIVNSFWGNEQGTATFNTQKILDFCDANAATSTGCEHCRSKSFIIDGTTYYGQLPNMKQLFDISLNISELQRIDTSSSSYQDFNFGESKHWWSSTQFNNVAAWLLGGQGTFVNANKTYSRYICPILELPMD